MVRNLQKLTLPVKINKYEFDNIQTGYTPLPGVHESVYLHDTENWFNLKTPSPMDCDDIEFLLISGSDEDNNRFSTIVPISMSDSSRSKSLFQFATSNWSSPLSETSNKTDIKVKQFSCSTCQKAFYRRDELKRHERIHSGERPLACTYCDKRFMRSDHLSTHIRIHTGEKPYKCLYCTRSFSRSDERLRHVRQNHLLDSIVF